jgi:hypothetical protein
MMHGPEKSDPAIVAGKDEACWRRRVWVGPPARCPPASSILAQGDLTAWLGRQDSNLCILCEFANTLRLGREDSNLCI